RASGADLPAGEHRHRLLIAAGAGNDPDVGLLALADLPSVRFPFLVGGHDARTRLRRGGRARASETEPEVRADRVEQAGPARRVRRASGDVVRSQAAELAEVRLLLGGTRGFADRLSGLGFLFLLGNALKDSVHGKQVMEFRWDRPVAHQVVGRHLPPVSEADDPGLASETEHPRRVLRHGRPGRIQPETLTDTVSLGDHLTVAVLRASQPEGSFR